MLYIRLCGGFYHVNEDSPLVLKAQAIFRLVTIPATDSISMVTSQLALRICWRFHRQWQRSKAKSHFPALLCSALAGLWPH